MFYYIIRIKTVIYRMHPLLFPPPPSAPFYNSNTAISAKSDASN